MGGWSSWKPGALKFTMAGAWQQSQHTQQLLAALQGIQQWQQRKQLQLEAAVVARLVHLTHAMEPKGLDKQGH